MLFWKRTESLTCPYCLESFVFLRLFCAAQLKGLFRLPTSVGLSIPHIIPFVRSFHFLLSLFPSQNSRRHIPPTKANHPKAQWYRTGCLPQITSWHAPQHLTAIWRPADRTLFRRGMATSFSKCSLRNCIWNVKRAG